MLLRMFAEQIDKISKLTGHGPITITSYIRNDNIHSCHYWGRALDIRVKDKPRTWYWAMVEFGKAMALLNPQFRMNPHSEIYRRNNQHIHIEIREKKDA